MESIFVCMVFSPKEQLLVVSAVGLLVLDAKKEIHPVLSCTIISFSIFN